MTDPNLYVGFSQGEGWESVLIQLFTARGVNHAFLMWEDAHLGWLVLGANQNGVTTDSWDNFKKTRRVPALFKPATGVSFWYGLAKLRDKLNEKYDLKGLLGMSVVEVARAHSRYIGNPLANAHATFCSQFCVDVMRAAGYEVLGTQPSNTIDPHELMHWMSQCPEFVQRSVPA